MIKLYFLEVADPLTGFGLRAGFTYQGKRYTSLVISQNGTAYVRTGMAVTHDLVLHRLSPAQVAAVHDFLESPDMAVEFAAPIE